MRNLIGPKKTERYRKLTGLLVVKAMTRGNTDHRIDLCLEDGSIASLYKNGEIVKDPDWRWRLGDNERQKTT